MARRRNKGARSVKKQAELVRKRIKTTVEETIPKNIEIALTKAVIIVGNKALEYTPLAFGMLVNSQFRRVSEVKGGWRMSIGYTTGYAAALHERTDWSPAPLENASGKKVKPATNLNAKSKFLTDAAKETREKVQPVIKKELTL